MTLIKFNRTWLTFRCLVLALLCTSACVQQANAQQLIWQKVFDTGKQDYCADVTTDDQGNIIVVGTTIPEEIDPPNHDDFLIIKYNSSGDTLWTRQYNQTVYDETYCVTTDHAGNIIVGGYIWTESTNSDMHIVKYDSDGNIRWTRTYSNGMKDVGEYAYGVATDSKDNIIVTGKAFYNFGDYVTIKYDSSGNFLWVRTYDGRWEDYAQDVAVDNFDNIIVTGYSDSNINWDWCTIKYSPDGDTLWVRRYDVAITDWAFGVTTDREGNVIVAGETHDFYPGSGGSTGMVVKYTSEGDTLWVKIFKDTLQFAEVGTFADVTTDYDGNIYLAGDYTWWNDSGQLWRDYYVAKCNSLGDIVWTTRCDTSWKDEASGIALDMWGNVIVTGTTELTYPYGYDYFTVKLNNDVSSIEESSLVPYHFILYPNYPNPFNASTTIRYDVCSATFIDIKIYDFLGRQVDVLVCENKLPGSYQAVWDAIDFASGLYFAQLVAGNHTAIEKLMLIK